MRASDLHRVARRLRELALATTNDAEDGPISASDVLVVEDVATNPDTTVSEITRRTRLAQSLVSRIVAKFHEHGVFDSKPAPHDGRSKLISLNDTARRILLQPRGARELVPTLSTELPHLTATEHEELLQHLERIQTLLTPPQN